MSIDGICEKSVWVELWMLLPLRPVQPLNALDGFGGQTASEPAWAIHHAAVWVVSVLASVNIPTPAAPLNGGPGIPNHPSILGGLVVLLAHELPDLIMLSALLLAVLFRYSEM